MKRTTLFTCLASAVLIGGILTTTIGVSADPVRAEAQVQALLNNPERAPTTAEWKSLDPSAASVLVRIAKDPKQMPIMRSNAVVGLTFFQTDSNLKVLTELLKAPKTPRLVRSRAMHVLGGSYSKKPQYRVKVIQALQPMLQAKHFRLREAAIQAVSRLPAHSASKLLTQRLPLERRPVLQRLIRSRLTHIEALQRAHKN